MFSVKLLGCLNSSVTEDFFLEVAQQMDRKAQLQSVSAIPLLDVQKVDTHTLIVTWDDKTSVAPVFLITRWAICHALLYCKLRYIVRTG